jgi:hypothetical protein
MVIVPSDVNIGHGGPGTAATRSKRMASTADLSILPAAHDTSDVDGRDGALPYGNFTGLSAPQSAIRLLGELAARLHVANVTPLRGGSGALVLRLRRRTPAKDLALKLLYDDEDEDVVDGHDLTSFRQKLERQRRLSAQLPHLYEPVLDEGHGERFSWFVTNWIEGCALGVKSETGARCEPLALSRSIAAVLETLTTTGYQRCRVVTGKDYLDREHVCRVLRRLDYLAAATSFVGPLAGPCPASVEVNGLPCPSPRLLLHELSAHDRLRATPRWLYFPVHGDLNATNVLLLGGQMRHENDRFVGMRLVDPRGDDRPRDLLYDLAKLLFSFALYEGLRAEPSPIEARIVRDGDRTVSISLTAPSSWTTQAAAEIGALRAGILAAPRYRSLLEGEGDWEDGLAFALGCHAVAEAGCRASQARRESASPAATTMAVAGCLALGAYLLDRWIAAGATQGRSSAFEACEGFVLSLSRAASCAPGG